mmetsp:Transcript_16510/g.35882  ORF Transcript_16510/g.35882 Transcript_16510/m.35882 type:complete len:246 (-) Transcript_16510:176-913(-)|eukprot:CAMPEP_0172533956 /NCGR_PEP_ID=MMETSP1067-20121228/6496_1 /TAXON_ID=265564 ORGANISM="Thalassiosira punctigera, Strain Tpunct2005C2" /NCGR_SAMPLE_ID=MMETSP1067 /ASSEMBLY_ACC=CAM_ASM_000444 /LENGTH=245 /DNA_ID=CAMNT_0013318681 /DNA_START=149 /DNA_END=886 /DNA_ORIENTATION=-
MSSGELRQRNVSAGTGNRAAGHPMTMANYEESHLSARALLAASPAHSSDVLKMHVPVLYTFLPASVQWMLSRCCPRGWSPQWKRRHLIALGEYLYRFKDEGGSTPKGSPIPVATADARIISTDDGPGEFSDIGEINVVLNLLPAGYSAVFVVSSIGKTQYFAVENREEAMLWVNSLRQMRQDAITRNMGHSKDIPYPAEWKSFDASAKRLKDQKTRIKNKLEAINKKEQEMQSLGGASAGLGYLS